MIDALTKFFGFVRRRKEEIVKNNTVESMIGEFSMVGFERTIQQFEEFPAERQSVALFTAIFQFRILAHGLDFYQHDAGALLDGNQWMFEGRPQASARNLFDNELQALTQAKLAAYRNKHQFDPKPRGLQPA